MNINSRKLVDTSRYVQIALEFKSSKCQQDDYFMHNHTEQRTYVWIFNTREINGKSNKQCSDHERIGKSGSVVIISLISNQPPKPDNQYSNITYKWALQTCNYTAGTRAQFKGQD